LFRVHTIVSYAITEAHYSVLAVTNGDWLLWQNTYFEEGQAPVNGILLPPNSLCPSPFPMHQSGCNLAQP